MAIRDVSLTKDRRSRYEQYAAMWNGCEDLSPALFHNRVSYLPEKKSFQIFVSDFYEPSNINRIGESLEAPVPGDWHSLLSEEEREAQERDIREVRGRFEGVFPMEDAPLYCASDLGERRNNYFSGTAITVPLGEGILNFCYAGFEKALERYMPLYSLVSKHETAHTHKEESLRTYELYIKVFPILSEVFYCSVYTAAFPPLFLRQSDMAINYYRRYVRLLQHEFLELLTFCFDESFHPEVLGGLRPSDRYGLWCRMKGRPSASTRREVFSVWPGDGLGGGRRSPDRPVELTEEQRAFAAAHGIEEALLEDCIRSPGAVSAAYECAAVRDMLYLEFTKVLEEGVRLQKCGRCGRYFVVKGNYHGQYCDRIAEGEARTCQQLSAQETYQEKLNSNGGQNALRVYQKYYKRYFARVKAGTLRQAAFKEWQHEAVFRRDACMSGTITLTEYTDWLLEHAPSKGKAEEG